jgi:hypothetical protein
MNITGFNIQNESTRLDETSTANVTYVGKAPVGTSESDAAWKIFKIDETGAVMKITYADSNSNYDNIWANRVGLTYG